MLEVIDREWVGRCRAEGLSADEIAAFRPAFEHEETARARRLVTKSIVVGTRCHADVDVSTFPVQIRPRRQAPEAAAIRRGADKLGAGSPDP